MTQVLFVCALLLIYWPIVWMCGSLGVAAVKALTDTEKRS